MAYSLFRYYWPVKPEGHFLSIPVTEQATTKMPTLFTGCLSIYTFGKPTAVTVILYASCVRNSKPVKPFYKSFHKLDIYVYHIESSILQYLWVHFTLLKFVSHVVCFLFLFWGRCSESHWVHYWNSQNVYIDPYGYPQDQLTLVVRIWKACMSISLAIK